MINCILYTFQEMQKSKNHLKMYTKTIVIDLNIYFLFRNLRSILFYCNLISYELLTTKTEDTTLELSIYVSYIKHIILE